MPYQFKTQPMDHQREDLRRAWKRPAWARWWEQGTGKTKPTIDETAALYERGELDGMLVLAPSGVHSNWSIEEMPAHLPDRIDRDIHTWYSENCSTKREQRYFRQALESPGLGILIMSYDALMTKRGSNCAKKFLEQRRCIEILDESARVKSPGAKRTTRVLATAKYAPYRRCLTGTPIANRPFDGYSQCKFLDPDCWARFGIRNFAAFKNYFGIWEMRENRATGKNFPHCVAYKNLQQLSEVIRSLGTRYLKEDVLKDLPPKLYSKAHFRMSPEQRRAYDSLKAECEVTINGAVTTALSPLVQLTRLQQIASGFLPCDDDEEDAPLRRLPGRNPRINLLGELVEDLDHQAIIWTRYQADNDLIRERLGDRCVTVDGRVTGMARDAAIRSWKEGHHQLLVATTSSIGEGYTLVQAKSEFYYNNSFNLVHRLQSEDRAHRKGQTVPVHIVDLIAEQSVDDQIVKNLRSKREIAQVIMGDGISAWI